MKYIKIRKEPRRKKYRKLIEYSCNNNTIMSFKIEKHHFDSTEKKEYENILYNILNLSKEEIINNIGKAKFITKIYNLFKGNKEIMNIIKYYFYKDIEEKYYTEEELKELEKIVSSKFYIKDAIDFMIFVTIENDMYNEKMNEYINTLKNNIVKIDKREYKPGWRNYDIYYFKIDNFLKEKLLEANRLFQWNLTDLPSDICFYKNGKIWLESIAHEEICDIYTGDKEEIDYFKKIGLKFEVLTDKEIEKHIEQFSNYNHP